MHASIKHNELTPNAKRTLKERLLSSIFIALFFIVLFVLGILADNVNNWSPIKPLLGRQICMWILLVFLLPVIFISCYEIKNVFFKTKIIPFIFILLTNIILIYAPTFVYILKYYGYQIADHLDFASTIDVLNSVTNVFSIVLACGVGLMVMTNTLLLWITKNINFKNWLILNLLTGFVSGFYIGVYFFLFVRGWLSLLWLMLIVFGTDSFAYFGGLLFGKHQMAKNISPKKTWEGFGIGQVITIILAMLILFGFSKINHDPNVAEQIMGVQFEQQLPNVTNLDLFNIHQLSTLNTFYVHPWVWWIVMVFITIILSVSSVLGDLMFSFFKRKYDIKDYGALIPGHGGILDRIDSHSVVISLYFILSFLIALFAHTVVFFANPPTLLI